VDRLLLIAIFSILGPLSILTIVLLQKHISSKILHLTFHASTFGMHPKQSPLIDKLLSQCAALSLARGTGHNLPVESESTKIAIYRDIGAELPVPVQSAAMGTYES
jgi:hypothetical protein